MTIENLTPVPGDSLVTEPRAWPHSGALVQVSGSWAPDVELVLECAERQHDGSLKDWTRVWAFKADDMRSVVLPPGEYRWQVVQDATCKTNRAWRVSVQPIPRPTKAVA